MDEKKGVIITYESLYDILRREKYRGELQNLDENFIKDVQSYLKEKAAILASQEKKSSIFASVEVEKTRTQLKNIKRILKELFELREHKITKQALMQSRMEENLENDTLLGGEKKLFQELARIIRDFREENFSRIFDEQPKELKRESEEERTEKVEFLSPMPQFVGEDLKNYGPFEEKQTAELPKKVAEVLIKNGKAKVFEK